MVLSEAVRFACARMLGGIYEADYARAQELVEDRLRELRAATGETVPRYEVPAMWRAGIEKAATKTVEQARAELGDHKHLWPAPDAPRDVAMRVVESAKRTGRRLCYWNGLWFAWCGTHYQRMTHEGFRDELYELLADAKYQGAKSELRWKPNTKKLNDVIDAARGLARLPDVGASEWIDGRKEQVIPCANGLLRVSDRMLRSTRPSISTSCRCHTATMPAPSARGGRGSWRKCSGTTQNPWHYSSSGMATCYRAEPTFRRCSCGWARSAAARARPRA